MSEQNEIVKVGYTDYKKVPFKGMQAAINWCLENEPVFVMRDGRAQFFSNSDEIDIKNIKLYIRDSRFFRAVKVMTEKITMFRYTYNGGSSKHQTPWTTNTFDNAVGWGKQLLKTEEKTIEITK